MANGSIRRGPVRRPVPWTPAMALVICLVASPAALRAQATDWSGLLALELARALGESGGPALGASGL
jgi:hypothetical protein